MLSTQIRQTDSDESFRNRDSSQLSVAPVPSWRERLIPQNQGENVKTDATLAHEVNRSLREGNVLTTLDCAEINVDVKNRTVYLKGHIRGITRKIRIEDAILAIPGIFGIENNLVLDDKLALEVAASLAALEQTDDCKLFTDVLYGVVSLNGVARDENMKLLAEKCAAAIPNARGVMNNVRVSGAKPGLQNGPFLQPAIGAIIYFFDGIFGAVKQVIINPNNRCVIQIVVQGKFSGLEHDLSNLTNKQTEILEKTIVIPVNLIRYLTDSAGYLTIKSAELSRYKDFNALYFTTPKTEWVPPFPYDLHDVLFNVDPATLQNYVTLS